MSVFKTRLFMKPVITVHCFSGCATSLFLNSLVAAQYDDINVPGDQASTRRWRLAHDVQTCLLYTVSIVLLFRRICVDLSCYRGVERSWKDDGSICACDAYSYCCDGVLQLQLRHDGRIKVFFICVDAVYTQELVDSFADISTYRTKF